MPVTEVLRGLGSFQLTLNPQTPKQILDQLDAFGHITVHSGKLDPRVSGDALLKASRYTGVYRGRTLSEEGHSLEGVGMALWLGDEEDKGSVVESLLTFSATPVGTLLNTLLPAGSAATPGTVYVTNPFTGTFQYDTPRRILDFVCQTLGLDWKINGDATVDVGLESDLFRAIPKAALVPKGGANADMFLKSLPGRVDTAQSFEDFTTRTLLLAQGTEAATVTATADINPAINPWRDLHGNPVKLTRIISESSTDTTNAQARAQLQLNRFSGPENAITCSTTQYDIKGDVVVGDYLYVFAPDANAYDLNNEVVFMGERMYPLRLRLNQMSWPISSSFSVAFRRANGTWIDLTPYFEAEGGASQLVVGGYNRTLVAGQDGGPAGSRPVADTSVPGIPTWVTPFIQSVYQSDRGESRAQVQVFWTRPLNVDGSNILDGSHFEIRYRSSTTPIFPVTWAQMELYTWDQLEAGTWDQPITYPAGPWQSLYVPWEDLDALIIDLPTNMPYEAQIRAVDLAKPANAGDWSTVTVWQTNGDTLPPATPAPPVVAASRLAVEITHYLGRADGGTFNLDLDLHHLEIHGEYEPLFTPSDSTLLGKLLANYGMIVGQIPLVGTVAIESLSPVYFKVIAVDQDGNKSAASTAVQATALLVDDAHISSLTVSKITAGTITASWVNAGTIWSGTAGGARAQMVAAGFEAYNSLNQRTFFVDAATGNVTISGTFQSGVTGAKRIVVQPDLINSSGVAVPAVSWHEGATVYVRASLINSNFHLMTRSTVTENQEGGYVQFDLPSAGSGSAYLGFWSISGGVNYYHQVGSTGAHRFSGHFGQIHTDGGKSALYIDQIGGSGTSQSFTYGPTMATTPLPFCEIQGTSGSPPTASSHAVTARSATGASIQYPAGNVDVMIWAIRYAVA